MWVESGNAILRREQEGLPRAAAGTDQQSVGTNCETKGRVRFTPHQNCRLMDDCIFPDAPPTPLCCHYLGIKVQ